MSRSIGPFIVPLLLATRRDVVPDGARARRQDDPGCRIEAADCSARRAGQASKVITAEQAADLSQVQYTGDDIKFMQGMIGHHAQAIQMVALVPSRTRATTSRSWRCASTSPSRTRSR
jgi:hypothetical protein